MNERLRAYVGEGLLSGTTDMTRLSECDAVAICVPTPLSKTKGPDLSYVAAATESVRAALRSGQLIVLESTTYPGTTREVLQPVLERTGLVAGLDSFLCYSPERVNPGNPVWQTKNTPKSLAASRRSAPPPAARSTKRCSTPSCPSVTRTLIPQEIFMPTKPLSRFLLVPAALAVLSCEPLNTTVVNLGSASKSGVTDDQQTASMIAQLTGVSPIVLQPAGATQIAFAGGSSRTFPGYSGTWSSAPTTRF